MPSTAAAAKASLALRLTLLCCWALPAHLFPFMNAQEMKRLLTAEEAMAGLEHIAIESSNDAFSPSAIRSLERRRAPINSQHPVTLTELLAQLDSSIWPCKSDRTLDSPLVRRLLNESVQRWIGHPGNGSTEKTAAAVKKDGQMGLLITLAQLFSKHPYIAASGRALPPNSTITSQPLVHPEAGGGPAFVFQLACDHQQLAQQQWQWTPVAVYPTTNSHSFLQLRLPPLPLDACAHSRCPTHCSYSVHGGVRVFARSCCREEDRLPSLASTASVQSAAADLCREDWVLPQRIFFLVSAVCGLFCFIMIVVVVRERRRQQHDRGWALMEPFFAGALILYSIPLLGWPQQLPWSCWMAIFGRQLGFTLFYGSVILKIYRNLQEYRVRKAQHVIVRELDLIIYLMFALFVVVYGILAWSSGSWGRPELWSSEWPQCPVEEFAVLFSVCEQLTLLYGIRLCYKARNSSWIERYQFTMSVVLETIVSLIASAVRYTLSETGSRDMLFLVAVMQLHLTITVNIVAIITPKFLVSSESNRRTLGNTSGLGSSGRAHPSLAKMRENLINGTIDFQEVPIVDMNPEDIRAELKRVYTQLRMYKLKNAYQDNPHISKRKGGGAKKIQVQATAGNESANKQPASGQKTARTGSTATGTSSIAATTTGLDRRVSIPPSSHNSTSGFTGSPKTHRSGQLWGVGGVLLEAPLEEEKSDLTVESAPYNVHLLTGSGKLGPPNVPLAADQSIRV